MYDLTCIRANNARAVLLLVVFFCATVRHSRPQASQIAKQPSDLTILQVLQRKTRAEGLGGYYIRERSGKKPQKEGGKKCFTRTWDFLPADYLQKCLRKAPKTKMDCQQALNCNTEVKISPENSCRIQKWEGQTPLSEKQPQVISLVKTKEATIALL